MRHFRLLMLVKSGVICGCLSDVGSTLRKKRCDLRFKLCDAHGKRLVFQPCFLSHFTNGLEVLPRDDVHVAEELLSLATKKRFGFLLETVGCSCRIRHELGKVVEESVRCLGHITSQIGVLTNYGGWRPERQDQGGGRRKPLRRWGRMSA